MTITWLGHSCFMLESGGFRALLDPYRAVRGLADISAEADGVYCSHGHFDHAYTDGVALTGDKRNPFTVRTVAAAHDDQGGTMRGENTIHVFSAQGLTVVHLGDLGHLLTPQQVEPLLPKEEAYARMTSGAFDGAVTYQSDTKGFYQPVYRFTVMQGEAPFAEVLIPALK